MTVVATLQPQGSASSPPTYSGGSSSSPAPWVPRLNDIVVFVAVVAALVVAYRQSVQYLIGQWLRDLERSYGFRLRIF